MATIVNYRDVLLQAAFPRLGTVPGEVTGALTAPAVALPASSAGVVSDWSAATGTFKVFDGTVDVTTSCAFSVIANPSTVTVSIGAATGIYSATAAGSWADASAATFVTFRAAYSGVNIDRSLVLTKAIAGAAGSTGAAGSRGSLVLYTAGSAWSDTVANNLITTTTGSSSKAIGDTVTISDATHAFTKYWSGAAWVDPGVVINGNLLVNGTVSATALAAGVLAFSNITGTIAAGSGVITGLAATATSSDYGSITGTKPPPGADVTLTAINSELTLTGGGLVLASGGAKLRGGQTAYDTGTGFWLGDVSGTTKFSIGNSAGSKLTWNGSALGITGDISGGTIAIGSGATAFSVGSSGTTYAYMLNGANIYLRNALGSSALPCIDAASSSASVPAIKAVATAGGNAIEATTGPISSTAGFTGNLTGNVTGNVTGSSGSCTGNAATATTASACSGNAATATTASACSGNAATATTATKVNYGGTGAGITYAANSGGTANSYSASLQTDGNFVVYHGGTPYWDATTDLSDLRLKKHVCRSKIKGLDVIGALEVIDFRWNSKSPFKDTQTLHTGLAAQQVQELVPDAVHDIDGTLLVHKEELVPYLILAVQELRAQLRALGH